MINLNFSQKCKNGLTFKILIHKTHHINKTKQNHMIISTEADKLFIKFNTYLRQKLNTLGTP